MNVIVTGANGFVGSALINELTKNGCEVAAIDICFDLSKFTNIKLVKFYKTSVEDLESIFDELNERYDVFYHFARKGSAGQLRSDENVQVKNALETVRCLRFASKIGCKKFICAGSIMEFEANEAIYSQETKPSVNYIYGVGKVLAHELCKPISNSLNIDLVWAYITNAYGIGEKSPRFLNTTLRKIINGEKLEFTAATQNYDFIYIDDVARAFYALGTCGKPNKSYLIGSGNAKPLKDFIYEIIEATKSIEKPHFGNVPFTGVNLSLDTYSIKEIQNDCTFKPEVKFKEGVLRTFNWLKEVDENE